MKILMVLCIIGFYALVIAGCSSSGGGAPYTPRDRTAPAVGEFTLVPPDHGWRGGACGVTATATDNVGVTSVVARISGPGASGDAFQLMVTAPGRYQGDVPVPANTNNTGQANTYYITVWAWDAEGNSGSALESLPVTVPAPEAPLPPPVAW